MQEPNKPSEDTLKKLSKTLVKRVDAGLITAICALVISFIGLLISRDEVRIYRETQKAEVLPIIAIDMGYETRSDGRYYEVRLSNVGAGIAHIQRVTPTINGLPADTYQAFENAIMNGRMRSNSTLTEKTAAGYLRAGDSVTPVSFRFSRNDREIDAYLRGQYGVPFEGLDLSVCYCSVFDDCWTVPYISRAKPRPAENCGIEDIPVDLFQEHARQRAAMRQE